MRRNGGLQRLRTCLGPLLQLAVVSSVFFASGVASADDTSVTEELSSGSVLPIVSTSVQMVSEEVTYRDEQVRTDFVLRNVTARQVTISVGFPIVGDPARMGTSSMSSEPLPKASEEEKRRRIDSSFRFASLLDDRPLSRRLVPVKREGRDAAAGRPYEYMYVASIPFEPHQTRLLQNFYHQPKEMGVNSGSWNFWWIRYLVQTGASWVGSIEKGVFRFFVPRPPTTPELTMWTISMDRVAAFVEASGERPLCYRSVGYDVGPPGYEIEEHGDDIAFVWRFADFEPDFNVEIVRKSGCDGEVVLPGYETLHRIVAGQQYDGSGPDPCDAFDETFLEADLWTYARALAEEDGWHDLLESSSVARFAVNLIHALHGKRFQGEKWRRTFSCFPWYEPKTDSPALKPEFQRLVDQLLKISQGEEPTSP